jgi:Uma2 family endonuclease
MSVATTPDLEPKTATLSSDEFFALRPKKNLDRWLFQGELREQKVTKRNPSHSRSTSAVTFQLKKWLLTHPKPRGDVYSGEAYFRIRRNPDTNVGVDVALSTPEQEAATSRKASFIDGPPLLAVEVLSPFDKNIDVNEMIEEYLDCGTSQVWILDPYKETVTVHRADAEPVMYTRSQTMPGGPELPGFSCAVAELFGD